MGTGAEIAVYAAMAAATAYSVDSSIKAGKQAQLNGEAQADQAAADANTERSAAVVQAERIRKIARIQAGEANASLAASGVDVGAGTAININQEITRNSEEDAALTIFGGANKASRLNVDGSNYKLAGNQARGAANSQAVSTVLNSASTGASNWKASAKTTN
jgi:hypothetical protein